jgi:hypothetical protein
MANNLIQIKRSSTTAVPGSLADGELAYSSLVDVLYIGNTSGVVAIAGARNPGVLTANQALIANSTSYINEIKVGTLTVDGKSVNTFITTGSNTALGSAANNELASTYAVKRYVDGQIATVTGGQVANAAFADSAGNANNATNLGGYAASDYLRKTENATLSGNVQFTGANTRIDNLNVGTINRSPTITLSGDVSGSGTLTNLGDVNISVTVNNANGVTLGTETEGAYVANVVAGGGISISGAGGATSTPTVSANVDNSTIEVSGGALQVKDNGIALGTKTTGDYVQNVTAGNGINVSVTSGEGSTPVISINVGAGLVSNTSGLFVDTTAGQTFDSLTVSGQTNLNGNVALGNAIQDKIDINGSLNGTLIPTVNNTYDVGSPGAIYSTGWFSGLRLGSGSEAVVSATGNTVEVHALTVNSSIVANTATFYHDVSIGGTLSITGNVVYSNVETYIVTDPLIQLAANNTLSDTLDIGFYGNYNADGGGHEHTGFFRDASDGIYKIFQGLTVAPTTYVDTGDGSYKQGTLQAYLNSGALVSNATNLAITATGSLAVDIVANTLTLSTPLAATSGGTGLNTYSVGDILVAGAGNTLTKLGIGADGTTLQSNGTTLVYSSLDGGTF